MAREWTRTPAKHPMTETWETELCTTDVVPAFDGDPEQLVADQLAHANEQLAIQSQYPGRNPRQ
jgi:hypothetical protein